MEYDVEKDKSKNQEKLLKSGGKKGVPLIDVEGIIVYGFSMDQIKTAVEERRNI
jgi:glutaredoxin